MRYIEAKKLKPGDRVILKRDSMPRIVLETTDLKGHRNLMILCDDGHTYVHTDVR